MVSLPQQSCDQLTPTIVRNTTLSNAYSGATDPIFTFIGPGGAIEPDCTDMGSDGWITFANATSSADGGLWTCADFNAEIGNVGLCYIEDPPIIVYPTMGRFALSEIGNRSQSSDLCANDPGYSYFACAYTVSFLCYGAGDDVGHLPYNYGFSSNARFQFAFNTTTVQGWDKFVLDKPFIGNVSERAYGSQVYATGCNRQGHTSMNCNDFTNPAAYEDWAVSQYSDYPVYYGKSPFRAPPFVTTTNRFTKGNAAYYSHQYQTCTDDTSILCVCVPSTFVYDPRTAQPTVSSYPTASPTVSNVFVYTSETSEVTQVGDRATSTAICMDNNLVGPLGCTHGVALLCYSEGDDVASLAGNYGIPTDRPVLFAHPGAVGKADNWTEFIAHPIAYNGYPNLYVTGCTYDATLGANCADFTSPSAGHLDEAFMLAGATATRGNATQALCSDTILQVVCLCWS